MSATAGISPGLHKHWRHHGYEWWTSDLLGHDGGNECPACGELADLIEEVCIPS